MELDTLIRNYLKEKFKQFADSETVIWIGSIVQGFSNDYSDIDLLLITDSPSKYTATAMDGDKKVIAEIWDDQRFDIEIWNINDVNEIIRKVNSYKKTKDFHQLISEEDLLLISNLLIARCVIDIDFMKEMINKINIDNFKVSVLNKRVSGFYNELEDIRGLLSVNDYYSLVYICRKIGYSLISAALIANGDYSLKEKWLYKRLLKNQENLVVELKELIDIYLFNFSPDNPGDAKKIINKYILKCSRLINKIAK